MHCSFGDAVQRGKAYTGRVASITSPFRVLPTSAVPTRWTRTRSASRRSDPVFSRRR